MLKIGCCGFPKKKEVYFKEFNLVELQSTFYQPPKKIETVEKWQKEAPYNFEFTLKGWQIITHLGNCPTYKRLKEDLGKRENYGFFKPTKEVFLAYQRTKEVAKKLKAKIIVFQSPPNFKENKQNIKNMYEFFTKIERDDLIFCWEERGNWRDSTIKKICKELNLIYCVDPFKRRPLEGKFFYFRLHGKDSYNYQYTDKELKELKTMIKGKSGYILFNNIYMWEDAIRFKKLL
jgi:uncharacterized protein YecE (DUF72 family)